MPKDQYPVTPAIRALRAKQVSFVPHLYDYEEHGGTHHAATELQVPEHAVIKTLIMQTDERKPLVILMHGDREVSTKQLARVINVKQVTPADPAQANKLTSYMVGGISPLGTRSTLAVYAEATIMQLERLYINGGKRGFLIEITPDGLKAALEIQEVSVAL